MFILIVVDSEGVFMVQNVSSQNTMQNQNSNGFGGISRIGMTDNGRVIYQVVDGTGQKALKMSVAQKDSDTFERSYNTIMTTGPKLQQYMQNTPPEKIQKKTKSFKMDYCWMCIARW